MKRTLLAGISLALGAALWAEESTDALPGGATTVVDESRNAFSLPLANLPESRRAAFFVGNSFFNQNWVAAPASPAARDGLGPLFNARSCSACHFKDGRSEPPAANAAFSTILLRVSVPGAGPHGGPNPHPVYGDQIQGKALPGANAEAEVMAEYTPVLGKYADGESYELRRPVYRLKGLGYGPIAEDLLTSARVAPAMIGLGLLESVPAETIQAMADPEDRDRDGISGRANKVWNAQSRREDLGRFGWKAEQPTILQQVAGAFLGDMGLTTSLMPKENHTDGERQCDRFPSGGEPEVSDKILNDVAYYSRTLAVPASRNVDDARFRRGKELFTQIQCAACHRPALTTGNNPEFPELSGQTIHPYTDLLLHDMGEGLADRRPVFQASGSEWRTPPLWGLGLVPKVNGHSTLLHDGRARNFAEAILWHEGEAEAAREKFRSLAKADREAVIAFLQSL